MVSPPHPTPLKAQYAWTKNQISEFRDFTETCSFHQHFKPLVFPIPNRFQRFKFFSFGLDREICIYLIPTNSGQVYVIVISKNIHGPVADYEFLFLCISIALASYQTFFLNISLFSLLNPLFFFRKSSLVSISPPVGGRIYYLLIIFVT